MRNYSNFITYGELAKVVGCSYSTLRRRHVPKMVQMYKIDLSRTPCFGMLPVKVCEDYFGIKLNDYKQKTQ